MKAKIAIIGKGNIGWAIKQLLKDKYEIKHGDITEGLDARDIDQVREFFRRNRCSHICWPICN